MTLSLGPLVRYRATSLSFTWNPDSSRTANEYLVFPVEKTWPAGARLKLLGSAFEVRSSIDCPFAEGKSLAEGAGVVPCSGGDSPHPWRAKTEAAPMETVRSSFLALRVFTESTRTIPASKVRGGVAHIAALVPTGPRPHFEVQVAGRGTSRGPDVADYLAGTNSLALRNLWRFDHVHVDVVELRSSASNDRVVAGPGGLVVNGCHPACLCGDDRFAATRHQILTLVSPAGTKAIAPGDGRLDREYAFAGIRASARRRQDDATRRR